ncbi:hypothetical protein N7448_002104 [Penicillium atrosanguineum]|uniref:Uncharacterized protein n=1 Tax=Penicillium atrosanguineum TaxID=1132637 RepID=A0A9W9HD28_9EURO|nr:hypothetical protein N7526_006551 [Penicillium atrosanguineum]KAJ5144712.1 hypothetical protein N7448_002104 [Penicillium atrosanguineum]KAJ5311147.1 hypothetical protein N7476_007007 [Penicillium atrosanguineum]
MDTDRDLFPSIPAHESESAPSLRCCCGRDDCALLEHNEVALMGLEKDLANAARLGQALLHRHESYMAEAEVDRQSLVDSLDALEREKRAVQAENARIVEENRALLEQLEGLNMSVADSDETVQSLTALLENTQAELRMLTVAAARAADLEAQIVLMETEQERLQETLTNVQEDEKSAVQRWRNAQLTLRDLEDQVERIEAEARQERQRHEEVVERMERKRIVERELDNAAGRLKGAAAASGNPGTNVVSRFVKDILQDNANLQVGIMELREMLESSNNEVQNLRDQVMYHQPLVGIGEDGNEPSASTTLSEELESKEQDSKERRVSQEFHIHHHYHTPSSSKKDKPTLNRRVKKKRPLLASPVVLHSAIGNSPRRSIHRSQSSGSSMNTILSQTSVSIPPQSRRWSLQTPPASSLASSPQSAFHTSSIFDRVDRGSEFSQPTSPESTVFSSPLMAARQFKGFDLPIRPMMDPPDDTSLFNEDQYDRPAFLDLCDGINTHDAIPEESESSPSGEYSHSIADHSGNVFDLQMQQYSLRKSTSHDSLLSVAGMDIHTPTNRHSRMGDWHPGMRIPQRIVSPSIELVSTPPVLSAPLIIADRARAHDRSSRSLLASMAAGHNLTSESVSIASADSNSTSSTATPGPRKPATLGRRVGGWVLGRWGMAPTSDEIQHPESDAGSDSTPKSTPAPAPAPAPTTVPEPRSSTPTPDANLTPNPLRFRYPGVNQKGPIMGLRPPPQPPIRIHPQGVDEDLLRESLAE